MEKHFVPYELSIELKELGFDEICYGFYDDSDNQKVVCNYPSDGFNSALLWQQAFDFIREKYYLHSYIELVVDGFNYLIYVDKKPEECEDYSDGPFETYEEAQTTCLMRLIMICKYD